MLIASVDKFPFRYFLYFLIITIFISVSGYVFYLDRKTEIEDELSRHIIAIKQIKLQQIDSEQNQRKKIIESFLNVPAVNQEFLNLFVSRPRKSTVQKVSVLTDDLLINLGFSSINIFDTNVDIIFTTDSLHNIRQNFLKHELSVMLEKESSSITNMYIGDNKNLIQAIVVPVRYKNVVKGYIWAEYSFFEYLHPIIDYTKGEPGSVEFILVKNDGNLAFLIKDIGSDDKPSIQTIPINKADREVLIAVPTGERLIKGIEFRGQGIYASAKIIAGTDWNLITKINEEQVIRSVQNSASIIFLIALLLIILSASITYAIWKRSRLHFLSRTYNLKREKDLLTERYASITRYANDIIFSVDSDGRILEANQRAMDIYGYTKDELMNMNFFNFSQDKDHDKKILHNRIKHGNGLLFETTHKRKDGSPVPVEISAKYVQQDDEKILLAIVRDNTERKKLQSELIAAKERAEENDRLKTIILSNMSHELNTPMSGIIGFSEILQLELADESQKEMASLIHRSGKRLNETLTAILDLSKIESQRLQLSFDEIELNKIIYSCIAEIKSDAESKGLKFTFEPSDKNLSIKTDPNILYKIIKYISNNGIKYTNQGELKITTTSLNGNAVVKIIDTGIGISKENLELIFEPFRQVSEGSNRNFEGTGIGLTITKKLVEILNGKIEVDSQPGKGTIVILSFPFADTNAE